MSRVSEPEGHLPRPPAVSAGGSRARCLPAQELERVCVPGATVTGAFPAPRARVHVCVSVRMHL